MNKRRYNFLRPLTRNNYQSVYAFINKTTNNTIHFILVFIRASKKHCIISLSSLIFEHTCQLRKKRVGNIRNHQSNRFCFATPETLCGKIRLIVHFISYFQYSLSSFLSHPVFFLLTIQYEGNQCC